MSQTKTWLGIALAWWMVWGVQAQSRFPDRPISMLVPFGPGGTRHRGQRRAAVFVEHPHLGVAGLRVFDLVELGLDRFAVPHIAAGFALDDRLGEFEAGNALCRRVDGGKLRHALEQRSRHRGVLHVARHAAFGVAGK